MAGEAVPVVPAVQRRPAETDAADAERWIADSVHGLVEPPRTAAGAVLHAAVVSSVLIVEAVWLTAVAYLAFRLM